MAVISARSDAHWFQTIVQTDFSPFYVCRDIEHLASLFWSEIQGKHVLVAYIMKPKAGYDYLATAAHFAAESSTGTNVNVCTTDDFTKSVDALVYYIDPDNEEMKIAYPTLLFDRNITDGRGMMCSFLTLAIGNNQGSLATFIMA